VHGVLAKMATGEASVSFLPKKRVARLQSGTSTQGQLLIKPPSLTEGHPTGLVKFLYLLRSLLKSHCQRHQAIDL
jgi:hypothetical protein